MSGFSVSVRSWRITKKEVYSSADLEGEEYILAEYPLTDDPDEKHVHAMPLSGIAFRMEILGISDPVEVLDIMLKELNIPKEMENPWIYPKLLESYYSSSTKIAKALADEIKTFSVRSDAPHMTPDDFLSDVRNLLKGQQPSFTQALSANAVMSAVDELSSARGDAVTSIQDVQQSVTVDDTEPMMDLRQEILGRSNMISEMADEHAYRAMETGAFYFARMATGKGT